MNYLNYIGTNNKLALYIRRVESYPILTEDEEYSLARRWRYEGDIEAARQLALCNLRYVVPIAYRYHKTFSLPLFDLIQEGNVGVMVAVHRFDPEKGVRFLKYAIYWIKAFIQDYVRRFLKIVKIGTTRLERKLLSGMKKLKNTVLMREKDKNERLAGEEKLEDKLDLKEEEFIKFKRLLAQDEVSLDFSYSKDDGSDSRPLLEKIATTQDPESILAQKDEEAYSFGMLYEAIDLLDSREKFVIHNRYISEEPKTLREIASHLNISTERVRQLENKALKKIKRYLEEKRANERSICCY